MTTPSVPREGVEAPTIEKEYKFLLPNHPGFLAGCVPTRYEQTYISIEGENSSFLAIKAQFPDIFDSLPEGPKDIHEARVRKKVKGDGSVAYVLTLKGKGMEDRFEVERDIDEAFYSELISDSSVGNTINKSRYKFPLSIGEGLVTEVDVYGEGLEGLFTAEVEQSAEEGARVFSRDEVQDAIRMQFAGQTEVIDVTDDKRFKNKNLAAVDVEKEKVRAMIDEIRDGVEERVLEAAPLIRYGMAAERVIRLTDHLMDINRVVATIEPGRTPEHDRIKRMELFGDGTVLEYHFAADPEDLTESGEPAVGVKVVFPPENPLVADFSSRLRRGATGAALGSQATITAIYLKNYPATLNTLDFRQDDKITTGAKLSARGETDTGLSASALCDPRLDMHEYDEYKAVILEAVAARIRDEGFAYSA